VINVTAVEGKFSVGKKSHAHPHTNMGKAALNMLTFTSATSFYQQHRILMNSVDTGCKSCCRGLELLPIPMPLAPLLTRATCTRAP
jgi:NAD(P)-dependent dehydrogenase (short-subunit alcohol dehydrogenase family)